MSVLPTDITNPAGPPSDLQRIGVMTGGGDAPGMNAAIRSVVRTIINNGREAVGIMNAYDGIINAEFIPMRRRDVGGILNRGGTILNCGRSDEFMSAEGQDKAARQLKRAGIDGLVIIGGDGSLKGSLQLQRRGFPVVGLPGTIDNDISHTDMAIGVDTALNTIVEAVDRIRDTASAHHRAFIVEVMGRRSGYLAVAAGIAAGADMVLIPEEETTIEEVLDAIKAAYAAGKPHYIILVAEGANLSAAELDRAVNAEHSFESRLTVLGHVVRGGTPTAYDRILAARMGVEAVQLLLSGVSGVMVGRSGTNFIHTPIEWVIAEPRRLNVSVRRMAIELAR